LQRLTVPDQSADMGGDFVFDCAAEAAMPRAIKTRRATAGRRRGAAAVVISLTIKPDLLNRLDAWCASRLPPATRSATIAAAVERLLAEVK
jgi:hypothetical protein